VVYIVTNSDTEAVQSKIVELGIDLPADHVIGGAKKYMIGETPDTIPAEMDISGLERPIFLRRSHYFKVLDEIRLRHHATWKDLLVVGDIWELDLILPHTLGTKIGLMVNENTPGYEREWIVRYPERARLIHTLPEVIDLVDTLL